MQLHNFDIEGFLRDYWQKQPLLIRNPWAQWRNPVGPDELAGLACEPEVESRLIKLAGDDGRGRWEFENGPIAETRFGQLGRKPWTLLVQAVDHHVPEVAALIEPFRFIPNWRIDDVMVSYAVDGGGVGPHFDQYDVFLIQGLGRRRWQVGSLCDAATEMLAHDELRLLAHFEPSHEWILEPGDILYVPPRFAHNGVALGDDCMTYSMGFRAPSRSELIAHFCDDLLAGLDDDDRFGDPDMLVQSNPGEISADALGELHAMITARLGDREAFARWFGQYSSTPKYPEVDWRPEAPIAAAEMREILAGEVVLCRNPASRFSFVRQGAGTVLLFVDGGCFDCDGETADLAEVLCAKVRFGVDPGWLDVDAAVELIAALYNQGSVGIEAAD